MDSTKSNICLYSYNSCGSSEEKLSYIQDIINLSGNKMPIFLVQEHFLLRSNVYKFKNFSREAKPTERNLDLSVTCGLSVVETIKFMH